MKNFRMLGVITMVIVLLFSSNFTYAAGADQKEVDAYETKQLLLIPGTEGVDIFSYGSFYGDVSWFKLRSSADISFNASNVHDNELLIRYETIEFIVNYFIDDYFFALVGGGGGISDIQPFYLIDKFNNIVVNPALNISNEDFKISSVELENHFKIHVERYGNVFIVTMSEPYEINE